MSGLLLDHGRCPQWQSGLPIGRRKVSVITVRPCYWTADHVCNDCQVPGLVTGRCKMSKITVRLCNYNAGSSQGRPTRRLSPDRLDRSTEDEDEEDEDLRRAEVPVLQVQLRLAKIYWPKHVLSVLPFMPVYVCLFTSVSFFFCLSLYICRRSSFLYLYFAICLFNSLSFTDPLSYGVGHHVARHGGRDDPHLQLHRQHQAGPLRQQCFFFIAVC